jgi:hypothetical protein
MFYNAETLKALQLRAPTPIETHLGGALRIYSKLEPGERAIMGGDTAEGTGGDRSTAVFRAFPSWRLLAEYEDIASSRRSTPASSTRGAGTSARPSS